MERAPRKQQKFEIQNSTKFSSQAYLDAKRKPLWDGALTKEEFFVLQELNKTVSWMGERTE